MAVLLYHWGAAFTPFNSIRRVMVLPLFGTSFDLGMLLDFGHLGVPLFFILSGYLLTAQLIARELKPQVAYRFWLRRAMRIYPAFWLQLVALVAIALLFGPAPEWGDFVDALGLIFLWVDLPEPMSAQLNGVWWTLPIELSFYVVLPFLVLLSARIGWKTTLACSLVISIAWRCLVMDHFESENYFVHLATLDSLPGSLFTFGIGFSIAHILARRPVLPSQLRPALLAVSALLFYGLLCWHRANTQAYWAGHWMLAFWTPMVAIIIGSVMLVLIEPPRGFGWLSSKPMVWLGDVSFGIYLWHYPLLLIVYRVSTSDWNSPLHSLAALVIVIVGTLLLAAFSYHCIEKPIMARRFSPVSAATQNESARQ